MLNLLIFLLFLHLYLLYLKFVYIHQVFKRLKKVQCESRNANAKEEDSEWKFSTSNNKLACSIIPDMPLKKRLVGYCSDEAEQRNGNDYFKTKPCDITNNTSTNDNTTDPRPMRLKIRVPRLSNRTNR
jgi:hypothetical protein